MFSNILCRNSVIKANLYRNCLSRLSCGNGIFNNDAKRFSTKIEESDDKPLPYLGSDAEKWKAKYSRMGEDQEKPWFQPIVIVSSTAIFLLYFCVFREENDLDEKLYGPIDPELYKSMQR